jgi:ABC-type glycerol-3-phosphate transport system substrate-binding protein
MKAEITQINLYISPHFEELLGKETVETLLLEFGEQNPDLRVRTANPAEGKNTDIFIFDESEYRTLVASGSLKELNSYIYGTSVRFSTARRQLAIPLASFMDLLFFNIDLLTAAGFDRPPKTKEEFLTYARAVSGGNEGLLENAYGTALSLSFRDGQAIPRDIFSWIWASGGDFHPEENRPFLNAAAMSADISFLGILYRERLLAPRIFDTTGDQRLEEFAQ